MGAWGTAIFSDDFACDIRDFYIMEIIKGRANEEATEATKDAHFPRNPDDDEIPVFWIALAVTQWKKGRLLPTVKDEAISAIDSGADMLRWEFEPKKTQEKRKDVLEKTKQLLLSPMPPAKKIPMPWYMKDDPWELGDVLSYKITRDDMKIQDYVGKYVVLKIVDVVKQNGRKVNYYAVYRWFGDNIPSDLTEVKKKGYLKFEEGDDWYFNNGYILLIKRDLKDRDIKVLESDAGFDFNDDDILKNGLRGKSLGGPLVFDVYVSRALAKYEKL